MMLARGGLVLANISVGLAFLFSSAVPLGSIFTKHVLSGPVVWETTGIARQLPVLMGNYWIPAILIYLLLRYRRFLARFDVSRGPQILVGVGNAVLVLYMLLRLAAATIPGGGASFVVAGIGSLLLALPGYICLLIGVVLLFSKRISTPGDGESTTPAVTLGVIEGLGLVTACFVPLASGVWMYAGASSPFRIARNAEELFDRRCSATGEKIYRRIPSARGLYLEKDEVVGYDGLRDGVYQGVGFGSIGGRLQGIGLIEFYETRRPDNRKTAASDGAYLRFMRKGGPPAVVGELESEYALTWREMATPAEKALKISGSEYVLIERKSGERLASAVYFVSHLHRKICGHTGGNSYSPIEFVQRAILPSTTKSTGR